MLVELSKEEIALIGESMLRSSEHYTNAVAFLNEIDASGISVQGIRDKANAFTQLHVKLLHCVERQPGKRDPAPGDKIHGTRTVHWTSHETKRYATGAWEPERPNYPAGWKEVILR